MDLYQLLRMVQPDIAINLYDCQGIVLNRYTKKEDIPTDLLSERVLIISVTIQVGQPTLCIMLEK